MNLTKNFVLNPTFNHFKSYYFSKLLRNQTTFFGKSGYNQLSGNLAKW